MDPGDLEAVNELGRPIIIVKAGSATEELRARYGDFEDWMRAGLGDVQAHVANPREEPLPEPRAIGGAVITGSVEMVTDSRPWMLITASWLRRLVDAEVPVLGICYGHQLLAQVTGGEVGYHPDGHEIGTIDVHQLREAAGDPLLGALPTTFPVHACHSQTVLKLPPEAVHLASSELDAHQAFRIGSNAWGVQFHPEFSESVMRHYVVMYEETLREQGLDPDVVRAGIRTSPAQAVLRRFSEAVACGAA